MVLLWEYLNIKQIVDLGPKNTFVRLIFFDMMKLYIICIFLYLCIFVFLRYFTLSRPMVLRIYCQNSWHPGLTAIKLDTISMYKSFSIIIMLDTSSICKSFSFWMFFRKSCGGWSGVVVNCHHHQATISIYKSFSLH